MKKILPILTLTTLTAAAFADATASAAAPVAGLSYNRIGVSREGQNTNFSVSNLVGGSNFLVTLETDSQTDGVSYNQDYPNYNWAHISFGYVFKNVVSGIDATVSVGAGNNEASSSWGINLRRSLSEIVPGLEAALGYKKQTFDVRETISSWKYELAYNIDPKLSVAYGIVDRNQGFKNLHIVSLRYNY